MRNGEIIKAKVREISNTEIKYSKLTFWKHYPGDKELFENDKDFYKAYEKVIPNFRNLFGKIIIGRDFDEKKSRMR